MRPLRALTAFSLGPWMLFAGCSEDAPRDRRTVPTEIYHDYGILDLGTRKTHDFVIPAPEVDQGEVVPQGYSGDCSCAVGLLMICDAEGSTRAVYGLPPEQRKLGPGESVLLRLTLDTRDKEPVDVERTLSRAAVSFQIVNGPFARYEKVNLSFHYGIRTPVRVTPVTTIDFGDLPLSSTYHQDLVLRPNVPGVEPTLDHVAVDSDHVEAKLEKRDDHTLLRVTVRSAERNGEGLGLHEKMLVRDPILVRTGLPDYPHVRIFVTGHFVPDIQYEPSFQISHGLFDFSQPKEAFVNITDHDLRRPAGFVVLGLEGTNGASLAEHFEVRFQELSERKTRVHVKYLGTLGGKWLRAWLKLGKEPGGEPVAAIQILGHDTRK